MSFSAAIFQSDSSAGAVVIILYVLLLFFIGPVIYFIPAIVAVSNKKQNAVAIGVLNLFLGWTLIGWVVALVWAMSKDVIVAQPPQPVPVRPTQPQIPTPAQKKCPDCAEMVLAEAKKCRFCGREFGVA